MAKYAHFDSSAQGPKPVVGWYDTEAFDYPKLPSASQLIEVDDSQWHLHFSINPHGWTVEAGLLVAPVEAK